MAIKFLCEKIKLAKIRKVRAAPRWADFRKFGMKRSRTRRIFVSVKKWRRGGKIKV